jgi:hypothetical protein
LYFYLFIGPDKVTIGIQDNENSDEINKYLDSRYVSATESCWRIFGFDMHDQYPKTTRLEVHLENKHQVTYKNDQLIEDVLQKNQETQLTQYFNLNKADNFACNLFYYEIPKYYRWDRKLRNWIRRKR